MGQAVHTGVFDESFPSTVKPTADFKFADVANFEEMYLWIKNIVPDALGLASGGTTGALSSFYNLLALICRDCFALIRAASR